jgi:hypothetical protein
VLQRSSNLELEYKSDPKNSSSKVPNCEKLFYFIDQRANKTFGQMSGQAVLAQDDIFS